MSTAPVLASGALANGTAASKLGENAACTALAWGVPRAAV